MRIGIRRGIACVAPLALAAMGLVAVGAGPASAATPTTYYVSSSAGNNSNAGTSQSAAWKTLAKVSNANLQPGDKVLFKRGDTWGGELDVNWSGSSAAPITLSAYGSGELPLFNGSDPAGSVLSPISIVNHDYLNITYLAITNDRLTSRAGVDDYAAHAIYVQGTTAANLAHYHFNHLDISKVAPVKGANVNVPAAGTPASMGNGIEFDNTSTGVISDLVFNNNNFHQTSRYGAVVGKYPNTTSGPFQNVTFAHNTCTGNGGSCFVAGWTTNLLIESNNITNSGASGARLTGRGSGAWFNNSTNVVVENNVTTGSNGWSDATDIHIDHDDTNVLYQYNVGSNTAGPGLEALNNTNGLIYRENFSLGDDVRTSYNQYILVGSGSKNLSLYDNTFVLSTDRSGNPISRAVEISGTASSYYNNIFAALHGSTITKKTIAAGNTFTNNLFFNTTGIQGSDTNPVIGDPKFNGGTGFDKTQYQLQAGSPALHSGVVKPQPEFSKAGTGIFAGIDAIATHDAFGNPVPATPNIGAYQGPGIS